MTLGWIIAPRRASMEGVTLPKQLNLLTALLLMGLLVLLVAEPARAHSQSDIWAWTECSRRDFEAQGRDARVGVDINAAFPPNTVRDGITFSFFDRLRDGTNFMNGGFGSINTGVTFVGYNTPQDISFGYRDIDSLGAISVVGGCVVHGGADRNLGFLEASVDWRSDWYTAAPRAEWEGCPAWFAYACSKTRDVQSTMAHEIIHGMGVRHPSDADNHNEDPQSRANAAANCGNRDATATMCGSFTFETARRTLDVWDLESITRQYANN